jgi:mannose-1-phosphate guanylyltransferase
VTLRQAVILVGGRGTRLWPLTAAVPKGLIPLAGVPFVEYQLRRLEGVGIEEAWLAVGTDHADAWQQYAASWEGTPRLEVSVELEPLDTAGPVRMLLEHLDERFLVLNGDVVFDVPLAPFVEAAPRAGVVLALARVADPSAYGVVVTDDAGIVQRFVEKPAPGTAPANTVNAGIYLAERRALESFELGPLSFERRVFPDLAAVKELGGVAIDGSWIDIGTPELLLDSHDAVLGGRTSLGQARGHVAADGAAVSGDRRGGWSWVGPGAVVEAGAIVDEAIVLDSAIVRRGARVRNSVVGWGAIIEAGADIDGFTLVGEDSVVGAGCELHGVRVAPATKLGARAITIAPPA